MPPFPPLPPYCEQFHLSLDYTFLTDFFLIYRLFITPMELLDLFMLRFQWALVDDSPTRQIVRIRTFVTLRHWLLNYFGYDFMRSKDLRQTLTQHLRSIAEHPIVMGSTRDQRIVRELRRYVQSLKRIHYRTLAQQKLERQSRKLGERQQCLYSRRASLQSHQGETLSIGSFFFVYDMSLEAIVNIPQPDV
jgi:hypothetical protein